MSLENNNPGNLEVGGPRFEGQIDPPDGIFLRFIDPPHGLRAIIERMKAYQDNDGCKTLHDIIYRWAPPADNNPTERYLTNVSTWTGIDEDSVPDFTQAATCDAMMKAITRQENGSQPFSQFTIDRAVAMVLGTA